MGQARLRVGALGRQRRGVRFDLELEQVKVVEVLHGQGAGGQRGHGQRRGRHAAAAAARSSNLACPRVRIDPVTYFCFGVV